MSNNIKIEGYLPFGINKEKERIYFSSTNQKWVNDIMDIKISDILSTPTVPVVNPNKILKKVIDVGVAKIEICIEI